MGWGLKYGEALRRGFGLPLAALALVFQLLAPPGFMIAPAAHAAVLVVCTGHGPLVSAANPIDHSGKAPKSRSDAPCAFAGHTGGVAAAPTVVPTPVAFRLESEAVKALRDQIPGRGLIAPPPPSQGPPILL